MYFLVFILFRDPPHNFSFPSILTYAAGCHLLSTLNMISILTFVIVVTLVFMSCNTQSFPLSDFE